jgi:hypothetical protein
VGDLVSHEGWQANALREHAADHVFGHHVAGDTRCVGDGQALGLPGRQVIHPGATIGYPFERAAGHDRAARIGPVLELDAEQNLRRELGEGRGELGISVATAKLGVGKTPGDRISNELRAIVVQQDTQPLAHGDSSAQTALANGNIGLLCRIRLGLTMGSWSMDY